MGLLPHARTFGLKFGCPLLGALVFSGPALSQRFESDSGVLVISADLGSSCTVTSVQTGQLIQSASGKQIGADPTDLSARAKVVVNATSPFVRVFLQEVVYVEPLGEVKIPIAGRFRLSRYVFVNNVNRYYSSDDLNQQIIVDNVASGSEVSLSASVMREDSTFLSNGRYTIFQPVACLVQN